MRSKLELLPFGLALGISVGLHICFFLALPSGALRHRQTVAGVVVMDLVPPEEPTAAPAAQGLPDSPAPTPESASQPQPAREELPAASASNLDTPTRDRGAPTTTATAGTEPSPRPGPPPTGVAPPVPKAAVPTASSAAPPHRSGSVSLSELLPTAKELARFRSSEPPDPAGSGAREATLGLGEPDARYRGYINHVHDAIFASWHVGRGLLVSGKSRRVVVRFSLNSLGIVENAEVVEPSGNPTLDNEALEAVRRGRLPPFPAHWTLEKLHLMAEFDYVFK